MKERNVSLHTSREVEQRHNVIMKHFFVRTAAAASRWSPNRRLLTCRSSVTCVCISGRGSAMRICDWGRGL